MKPSATSDEAPDMPAHQGKSPRLILPMLVVLLWGVIVGGGIFAYMEWHHPALTKRFFAANDTTDASENLPTPTEKPKLATDNINAALEEAFDSAALQASITEIMDRTMRLEKELSKTNKLVQDTNMQEHIAPLVIALVHLREAIQQSRPYMEEMLIVRSLTPNEKELQPLVNKLDERAEVGIPSIAMLRNHFAELVNPLYIASKTAEENDGLWQKMQANLSKIIIVRRIDEKVEENSVDGRIVNIQHALERGDVKQAVLLAEKMQGAEAQVVKPWLQDARTYLGIHNAMDNLYDYILKAASSLTKAEDVEVIEAPRQ